MSKVVGEIRVGDTLLDGPERYYLIRVEELEVSPQLVTPLDCEVMVGHRWWNVEEVQEATAIEVFYPTRLGELVV